MKRLLLVSCFLFVLAGCGQKAVETEEVLDETKEVVKKEVPAKKEVVKEEIQNEEVKQETEKVAENSSNVPADWKTYKNVKYGFEFSYPNYITNFSVEEKERKDEDGSVFKYISFLVNPGKDYNGTGKNDFPFLEVIVMSKNQYEECLKDEGIGSIMCHKDRTTFISSGDKVYVLGYFIQDGPVGGSNWLGKFYSDNGDVKKVFPTFKLSK